MWKPLAGIILVFAVLYTLVITGREDLEDENKKIILPPPINYSVDEVLGAIRNIATNAKPAAYKRVAVGYNTNTDLIVDGIALVDSLLSQASQQLDLNRILEATSTNTTPITDLESFLLNFVPAFKLGAAAERIIQDEDFCKSVVSAAEKLKGTQEIGGNAALMARKFYELSQKMGNKDVDILVAGSLPESLRSTLPEQIRFVDGAPTPKPHEVHLILEYAKDAKWQNIQTPRANRFIVHCDRTNAKSEVVDTFDAAIKQSTPDLLILSGLHLWQDLPPEQYNARLNELKSLLSTIPLTTSVHLELASMSNVDFLKAISEKTIPFVDSLGLNEQELIFAFFKSNKRVIQKELSVMTSLMYLSSLLSNSETIHQKHTAETMQQARLLSRIHLHTLKYHIILQRTNHGWGNATNSVVMGSYIATTQACATDNVAADSVEIPWVIEAQQSVNFYNHFNRDFPAVSYINNPKRNIEVYVAPVAVCKNPQKTVGLGDAISAAGLLVHSRTVAS